MNDSELLSNAQSWELEVVCKDKKYRDGVIKILTRYEPFFAFEIDYTEDGMGFQGTGRCTIFIAGCWFNNLAAIARKLDILEKHLDPLTFGEGE